MVYCVAGLLGDRGLLRERPFRAPHHTISDAGLVGGASSPRPGEISLAHHGVLFLDELLEFRRHVLEALRQPLEDGEVTIARAGRTATYPAQVMLVAAMNPCPCGHFGDRGRPCSCTSHELRQYRRRISGPLLDRIDLHVDVPAVPPALLGTGGAGPGSVEVRARVARARERQVARAGPRVARCNARLRGAALRRLCAPDDAGRRLLADAVARLGLSARAHDKVLRVARTIADLDGREAVRAVHLAEAIQYRVLDRPIRLRTEGSARASTERQVEGGSGRPSSSIEKQFGKGASCRSGAASRSRWPSSRPARSASTSRWAWAACRAAASSRSTAPSRRARPR